MGRQVRTVDLCVVAVLNLPTHKMCKLARVILAWLVPKFSAINVDNVFEKISVAYSRRRVILRVTRMP